jgi:hypothetical protein
MVFRIYYVSHAIQCDSAAPERHSTKSAPGGVKDAETLRGIKPHPAAHNVSETYAARRYRDISHIEGFSSCDSD